MRTKHNEGIEITGGNVQIGNAAVGRGASISVVIERSLAKADEAKDKPELQQAIKELCYQITELAKKLPAQEQSKVGRDLEAFVSEATSQSPRRPWYEFSAKGLVEAAKAVGELASPVAAAVKTVLGLLVV